MRYPLLVFSFFASFLHANWEELFPQTEDPTIAHHVNVITGQLTFSLIDTIIQGPSPLPIKRSYSSSGAFEREQKIQDLLLASLQGNVTIQGGWSFLPELHLLLERNYSKKTAKAYLREGTGTIEYVYSHTENKDVYILIPSKKFISSSEIIGARNNTHNYRLKIKAKKGKAILYLPTGGFRIYEGEKFKPTNDPLHYKLQQEQLPHGQVVHYSYDKKGALTKIALKNFDGSKTYSWVNVKMSREKGPFPISLQTSDGHTFHYSAMKHEERVYLKGIQGPSHPKEVAFYIPSRKGLGLRIESLKIADHFEFTASYVQPKDKQEARNWHKHPEKKSFSADKVERILSPTSPNGDSVQTAQFTYQKHRTEVRDAHQYLTRYLHDGKKLNQIEYFDEKDQLYSTQKFFWKSKFLVGKAMLDPTNRAVFSKTFICDSLGNVTEEVLWGNLTGEQEGPFHIADDGSLHQADSYWKRYQYLEKYNVPILEEEENGPTFRYFYKSHSDLIEAKFTCEGEKILKREFFLYDTDHLLITEIVDDGSSRHLHDLTDVSERQITRYENNSSGLPEAISTYYLEEGMEKLLIRKQFTYSSHNKVNSETVFDSTGEPRYTTYTDYNALGCPTRKTDPLGQESRYEYDDLGKLIRSEEIGLPIIQQSYDCAGRQVSETVNGRTKRTSYDTRGNPIEETDEMGNITHRSYDSFGRCRTVQLPIAQDEREAIYTPIFEYVYDLQGNVAIETNPRGESLQTFYTALRKPYRIIQADGSEIRHFYNKNGTLAKTYFPEGTEHRFTYDIFQRMASKKVISKENAILSEEFWVYNIFHLLSYTNPRGLTTFYHYDKAGRLIYEVAEGRQKSYTYDALGFLEKVSDGVVTHVELHDPIGRTLQQWTEDAQGRIENQIVYTYFNNKKSNARRQTSQGEAFDQFFYDNDGRLERHIDPLGNSWQFHFAEMQNALGQNIWTKRVTNPIGNTTQEVYDVAGKTVSIECFAQNGQSVSQEKIFYDRAGNKAKVLHTVFQGSTPKKTITLSWTYNSMHKVVEENEAGQKITSYRHFPLANREEKTLPNGTTLITLLDGLGRPVEYKSSDDSLHLRYIYSSDHSQIKIHDLVHQRSLNRRYNLFNELIEENSEITWSYDSIGRCETFHHPQIGMIHYSYVGMHLASVERLSKEGVPLYAHHYTQFDPNGHVSEEWLAGSLGQILTSYDLLERPSEQNSIWLNQKIHYGPSGLANACENSLFPRKTYDYDALNQIAREGDQHYQFDSLGNSVDCLVNDCNQLLEGSDCSLKYDQNGNPLERTAANGKTEYQYDALGRLTTILSPNKIVHYQYDPLSRLYSKEVVTPEHSNTFYYLYDNEREIGSIDPSGTLLELKVLGLGVKGEIGAAIAVELKGELFVPLHDFRGNVVALLSSEGELVESSNFNAFGLEAQPYDQYRNPWRFSSKRTEETGLIFFGLRFYDPVLQRFLTPDPSGFADGPNLYLYTHNSPLNRLDLFGLNSEEFLVPLKVEIPYEKFCFIDHGLPIILPCKFVYHDRRVNGFVFCGAFNKLNFSPKEQELGTVDILNHLHELVALEGANVNIITTGNGISTKLKTFREGFESVVSNLTEGTLTFGIHNRSKGFFRDTIRLFRELWFHRESHIVRDMKHILPGISERLAHINRDGKMIHLMHSENGLITHRAYEKMPKDWQNIIQQTVFFGGYGLVLPIPKEFGIDALNIYSKKDGLTLGFKKYWDPNATYDIRLVPCTSKWHEKSAFMYDHDFLAPTGKRAVSSIIDKIRSEYGIYNPNTR